VKMCCHLLSIVDECAGSADCHGFGESASTACC
jgi:hypothetical protein